MKKRPASSGGPRESITDFAIRANLTYEQARRELLVGHVRGGRDGGGRLYVESRSVDEFVEANTHSADTVTRETAARMISCSRRRRQPCRSNDDEWPAHEAVRGWRVGRRDELGQSVHSETRHRRQYAKQD